MSASASHAFRKVRDCSAPARGDIFGKSVHAVNVANSYILVKGKCRYTAADFPGARVKDVDMGDKANNFFKEWRKFRGLTQEQAAELCDLGRAYLSELETGRKRHNEDVLAALAAAYDCDPWQLLGQNPQDPNSASNVVDIWDHIPEENKGQALEVLRAFVPKNGA